MNDMTILRRWWLLAEVEISDKQFDVAMSNDRPIGKLRNSLQAHNISRILSIKRDSELE